MNDDEPLDYRLVGCPNCGWESESPLDRLPPGWMKLPSGDLLCCDCKKSLKRQKMLQVYIQMDSAKARGQDTTGHLTISVD